MADYTIVVTPPPVTNVTVTAPNIVTVAVTQPPNVNVTVAQAGQRGPGASFISEVPAGAINGTNMVFTTSKTPSAGLFILSLNGLVQGAGDYSLASNTITFLAAPVTGDSIHVFYSY